MTTIHCSPLGLRAALLATALGLTLGVAGPARAAATANFQGLCTWNATSSQYTCSFDARRPASSPSACPGSFIWKYSWDFDDGSSLLTGNPLVSHIFPDRTDRFVSLRVICWNGQTADRLRHVCSTVGTLGCIQVNGTWN
jgi:hypothetical protein